MQIHDVAAKGTAEELLALIAEGADLNIGNESESLTPLMKASPENMRILVQAGTEVDYRVKSSRVWGTDFTALWFLSTQGTPEQIATLIELGADIEATNAYGFTPLARASLYGKQEQVETLLAFGANIEARVTPREARYKIKESGFTPLMLANPRTVHALINAGARLEARTERGETPLMLTKNKDVMRALLEAGADVNARALDGRRALYMIPAHVLDGCDSKTQARIKAELSRVSIGEGTAPKNKRKMQFPIGDLAAAVEAGANLDIPVIENEDEFTETPYDGLATLLMEASKNGQLRRVEALLKAGASADASNEERQNALMWASAGGASWKILHRLVEAGADLEAADVYGRTPVHFAVEANQESSLKDLVELGARLDVRDGYWISKTTFVDDDGLTPIDKAVKAMNPRLVEVLLEMGEDPNGLSNATYFTTHLHVAASQPESKVLSLLIKAGADLELRDVYGRTPLMIASKHGREANMVALLAAGADLHSQDIFGNVALDHFRSEIGRQQVTVVSGNGTDGVSGPVRKRPSADLLSLRECSPNAAKNVPNVVPEGTADGLSPLFRNLHTEQELELNELQELYNHFLNYTNDDQEYEEDPEFGVDGGEAFEFAITNMPQYYLQGWEHFCQAQGWEQIAGHGFELSFPKPPQATGKRRKLGSRQMEKWDDAVELLSQHVDPDIPTYDFEIPGVVSVFHDPFEFIQEFDTDYFEERVAEMIREMD